MNDTYRVITLLVIALIAAAVQGESADKKTDHPTLIFRTLPAKPVFKQGEDIVFVFSIRNNSPDPIFVSRLTGNEFVDIKLVGPDGKDVPWQGTGKIDSKSYSPLDFIALKSGERVRASRTISLKDGRGFVLQNPGRYSAKAEYSLEPREYFAPLAGKVKVPTGSFPSSVTVFCLETCNADVHQ